MVLVPLDVCGFTLGRAGVRWLAEPYGLVHSFRLRMPQELCKNAERQGYLKAEEEILLLFKGDL